jgi:hypothetical protein
MLMLEPIFEADLEADLRRRRAVKQNIDGGRSENDVFQAHESPHADTSEHKILNGACPYAPPIDPIWGSGIAIMPPARIPGRLTSSRSTGSTHSVIFCESDPHRPAVWLVCHIPLPVGLSMHSCKQDQMATPFAEPQRLTRSRAYAGLQNKALTAAEE